MTEGFANVSVICKPPSAWKQFKGKSYHTWLRTTESDLKPLDRSFIQR